MAVLNTDDTVTNLDLDQFLDSVRDKDVLDILRAQPNDGLVSRAHPAVLECFFRGLLVVQVPQNNTWAANDQLTGCVICGHLLAICVDDTRLDAGYKGARRTEEDVVGMS